MEHGSRNDLGGVSFAGARRPKGDMGIRAGKTCTTKNPALPAITMRAGAASPFSLPDGVNEPLE